MTIRQAVALFVLFASSETAGAKPACLSEGLEATDAMNLVTEATHLLAAAGHDPGRYRAEIRTEASLPLPGMAGDPAVSVVFWPLDNARDYAVGVVSDAPCVLTWIWRPREFTEWQRSVVERAAHAAREERPGWARSRDLDVRVTETRDRVGVRVWPLGRTAVDEPLLLLLLKSDLSQIVGPGPR